MNCDLFALFGTEAAKLCGCHQFSLLPNCTASGPPVLDFLGGRCFVTEEKSAVVTFSALIQIHWICRAFL
jgi:hypothetical protein